MITRYSVLTLTSIVFHLAVIAFLLSIYRKAKRTEHMTSGGGAAATLPTLDEDYTQMDSWKSLTHYMTTLAPAPCSGKSTYINQAAPAYPFKILTTAAPDGEDCKPERYIVLDKYTSVLGPPSNACKPSTTRYTIMITLQHDVPIKRSCLFRIMGGNMDNPHEIGLYITPMLEDGGGNKQYVVQAVHGTETCDSKSATCTPKTLDSLGDMDYTYFLCVDDSKLTVHRYHGGVLQLAVTYTSITKFDYTSTVPIQCNYGNSVNGRLFSFGIFDAYLKESSLHNIARHCHLYMQTVTNETVRSLFEENLALRAKLVASPFGTTTTEDGSPSEVQTKCGEIKDWSDISAVVSASQACRDAIAGSCVAHPTSSDACICWDKSRTAYASDQCAGLRAIMKGGALRDLNNLDKADLETVKNKYTLCPVPVTVPVVTKPVTTPAPVTAPVTVTPTPAKPTTCSKSKPKPIPVPDKPSRNRQASPRLDVDTGPSCSVSAAHKAVKLKF